MHASWIEACSSLLAPRRCLACGLPLSLSFVAGSWRRWICAGCERRLETIVAACPRCACPNPASPCAACAGPHELEATTALVRYRGTGRRLLHKLKYGGCEALAPELGRRLGQRLLAGPSMPADLIVVPVPLHPWRHLRRGFNQAAAIGAALADTIDRPLVHALRRRRHTRPLYQVPRLDRAAALEQAFTARWPTRVDDRPVLLVDDIRTSGATLRAAARALLAAGAGRVEAAVVAR